MNPDVNTKLEEFFGKFKQQKYRKGEILIRAGDEPSGIFYLKSGRVKKYAISKKGDELVVNIFKPGAFFPMSHAINRLPNNFFYEAMENLELIKAPTNDVDQFIKSEPEVMYDLLARVYRGSEGLLTRITYLMAGNAYSRLISELIINSKRFGEKHGKEVIFNISETDLATQTGMTRETVSREMKVLKDNGLITFEKGKIVINDLEQLEHELNSEL